MQGDVRVAGVTDNERVGVARTIVDENQYMVLATADARGRPWASPVWYAVADRRAFFWVSSHEATHSRNIEARPEIGIVIFDSRAPLGTGVAIDRSILVKDGGPDRRVAIEFPES